MSRTIFTLGTGQRDIATFLKIIKDYHIDKIIDVRRFPTSKYDHFQQSNLIKFFNDLDIKYIHLGVELGGFRKCGYEKYMETDEFARGIDEIVKTANKKNICIICAETLPWKCHRRFIAQRLMEMGYRVIHIIDEKHTWQQKLLSPPLLKISNGNEQKKKNRLK